MSEVIMPQLTIQSDWQDAASWPSGSFWISCGMKGKTTIYSDVTVSTKNGERFFEAADDGFKIQKKKGCIMVECVQFNHTSYFVSPTKTFQDIHVKSVRCMNLSPSGSLAVTCADDEALHVWQTSDGTLRRVLEGHVSDVSHCRFFPSGVVVLSGGRDTCLKIWSVEDGSCALTLTKHKGAITDTSIIDCGRNFISCSRDGSVLLWDCASASCVDTLSSGDSPVNCCSLSNRVSANEVDASSKLLVIGRENGHLSFIDVGSRSNLSTYDCKSAVNDCVYVTDDVIACGLQNGCLVLFDVRRLKCPVSVLECGVSSINCLDSLSNDRVVLGRADGSCSCVSTNENAVPIEMTGANCDSIYDVCTSRDVVYTTCRDHAIRKYHLNFP